MKIINKQYDLDLTVNEQHTVTCEYTLSWIWSCYLGGVSSVTNTSNVELIRNTNQASTFQYYYKI